jgi:hypothetical protein
MLPAGGLSRRIFQKNRQDLLVDRTIQKICFLAICGVRDGAMAVMIHQKGYKVWGVDDESTAMRNFLQEILSVFGYKPAHLDDCRIWWWWAMRSRGGNRKLRNLNRGSRLSLPDAIAKF